MALYNTDLVTVQFSVQRNQADKLFGCFSDLALPFNKEEEEKIESVGRRARNAFGNGRKIMETKKPTECGGLLAQLEAADFELVGFWWQRRVDRRDMSEKYLNVRFTFARELRDDAHPAFLEARDDLQCLFARLVNRSFWGVRIFENPLFENNEVIEGRQALSINLGDRRNKDQKVWDRDEDGEKVGDAPKNLQPDHVLALPEEGEFTLLDLQTA